MTIELPGEEEIEFKRWINIPKMVKIGIKASTRAYGLCSTTAAAEVFEGPEPVRMVAVEEFVKEEKDEELLKGGAVEEMWLMRWAAVVEEGNNKLIHAAGRIDRAGLGRLLPSKERLAKKKCKVAGDYANF